MKTTILILLIFISTNALAEADKIVKTIIKYDKVVKTQAKYWQIEPQDYIKAQRLREQYKNLGNISNLTPLEILGIFATTKTDRNKYARMFARIYRQTTKKVLDFQKSVNQAHKDLYGADSMFDYQKINTSYTRQRANMSININDCQQSCINKAKKLINASFIIPVDFYFTNATDTQIRVFAQKLSISIAQVQNKQITLNYSQ